MERKSKERIPTDTEMKAVALIARGDTQKSIAQSLGISENTVVKIKHRNPETLQILKTRITERAANLAEENHTKSMMALNDRLDDPDRISTGELVTISREMHNQAQIAAGKPTAITASAVPQAKADLKALVDAIENGDEVVMQQIVFNGRSDDQSI